MLCMINAAAQRQVAVLSHEGEVKAFYGEKAYQQAMEEANHGDVITLSSGIFDAAEINKAVTIRGAGMENDPVTGRGATIVHGDYSFGINNGIKTIYIEGICFDGYMGERTKETDTLDYVSFSKCKFTCGISFICARGTIRKCVLNECKSINGCYIDNGSVDAYNSFIGCPNENANYHNCIIRVSAAYRRNSHYNVYNSVLLVGIDYIK